MIDLSPIVLFVYNRPNHTRQVIEALLANPLAKDSDLYIYSDAPKTPEAEEKVSEVRKYIHTITGFKSINIIEREKNFGLAGNIIDGVTTIVNQYGKIIVLEDDIVVSPVFLNYMNDALNHYQDKQKVWSISAWSHPIDTKDLGDCYFWFLPDCWGWATWKDRWKHYKRDVQWAIDNFSKKEIKEINISNSVNNWHQVLLNKENKIRTWAIFNCLIAYKHEALSLAPSIPYVYQIGLDNSGMHCSEQDLIYNPEEVNTKFPINYPDKIELSKLAYDRIYHFEKLRQKPILTRIWNRLLKYFRKFFY